MPLIEDVSTANGKGELIPNTFDPVYVREGNECLLWLALKIKLLPRANLIRRFYSGCLQSEDAKNKNALNIPVVPGHVCDIGQVFAFACTEN